MNAAYLPLHTVRAFASPFPARPIRWPPLSIRRCLTSLADCTTYYALC